MELTAKRLANVIRQSGLRSCHVTAAESRRKESGGSRIERREIKV
jgi:uncharacterized protein YwlG (UPF0340 family)